MKRSVRLAAGTTAVSLALLAGTVPAYASGGSAPVLARVSFDEYARATLIVEAYSDSPITKVTAHFFPEDAAATSPATTGTTCWRRTSTAG